jgi:hypothetical protein
MSDTIEVDVSSLMPVPLRHQLVRRTLTELQAMAYDLHLSGPIARATKHELAARLASDILARRVRDEDSTVGSGNDDEAAPQCGLHREERQWEDGGDEGGPAAR